MGKNSLKSLSILLAFTFFGCRDDRSKDDHTATVSLCDNKFYVEKFTISGGGALGGDRQSDYLTDSVNFRRYLGTYDNAHEVISVICKGDSIYVYHQRRDDESNRLKPTSIIRYSIFDLKKTKVFE